MPLDWLAATGARTHNARLGIAIHLLGAPRVERDGRPVPAPRGHKAWALLAYLILCPSPPTRSHLAALLFEEALDPLAALRWNLSELRRLMGWPGLRGEPLRLPLNSTDYVDIHVVANGAWVEALCVSGLGRELLEGMKFPASPSFEVWLANERRRLVATTEAVLREAALARLAVGAAAQAAELATRLVRSNPLDENFQALLVRSLAAAGDGVGAARQAAACRDLFRRELGTEPGATLASAIRTATATPVARPVAGRPAVLAQLEAGEAAIGAGALEAGVQCLRRAVVESDATGDPALRARTRIALGEALVHAARGCDEEGASALHEALVIGEPAAPLLGAAACRELGYVEFLSGRYERALVWLKRAAGLAGEDAAEQARIAIVHGATLSDTAHYAAAIEMLHGAVASAESVGDPKRRAYALSMLGRAELLSGDIDAAVHALDQSLALAQGAWTAFVPWPLSLRAEAGLLRGEVAEAADRFEHAFALGCQMGDPCWEGIAGRGLGRIAMARGETRKALEMLTDAVARCVRFPDAYLWGKGYALDVLCGLAVDEGMPQSTAWIDELQVLAGRSGMRELVARAHLHRCALGDTASGNAARLLAVEVGSPRLMRFVEGRVSLLNDLP